MMISGWRNSHRQQTKFFDITVILIHCTDAGEHFDHISDSGKTRRADLLAMTNESLKAFLLENGFITTTWKELTRRRALLKR